MRMGVDEAGQNCLSTQIDLSNAGSRKIHHVRIFPNSEKSAPRYRDSLRDWISRIHRHDVAVMQNNVRFFLLKRKKREGSKRAEKFAAIRPNGHSTPLSLAED